jgi:hypothetical protein
VGTAIPRHRQFKPFPYALRGGVAQQALRLADVGQAVADVTGAEVAVDGLGIMQVRVQGEQVGFDLGEEVV